MCVTVNTKLLFFNMGSIWKNITASLHFQYYICPTFAHPVGKERYDGRKGVQLGRKWGLRGVKWGKGLKSPPLNGGK